MIILATRTKGVKSNIDSLSINVESKVVLATSRKHLPNSAVVVVAGFFILAASICFSL